MTGKEIAMAVLLGIGVVIQLLCCIGVLAMRNPYARLHFLSPASSIGIAFFTAAILLNKPASQNGAKALFIFIFMLIANPMLSHATARAIKIRSDTGVDSEESG